MNKVGYIYIVLCVLVGILFVINLNLVNHTKTIEQSLNKIAVAIEVQNNILNYNPNEENKNE
jgi:hypothetical protein